MIAREVWSISKDAKPSNYSATKYIKKIPYDRDTGEYMNDSEYMVFLDEERIAEEEQMDGYYVICTNVIGLTLQQKPFTCRCRYTTDQFFQLNRKVTDDDIISIYKGLWRIEETFKVTKSDLKAWPVYVSKATHIRAYFLICFVTLLLMRFL